MPGKEVDYLPRLSAKVQARKKITTLEAMRKAPKLSKANARRCLAITKNLEVFFFTFELGFNRYIQKVKELFSNIDPNHFTLTDLDAQSLEEEVFSTDPYIL